MQRLSVNQQHLLSAERHLLSATLLAIYTLSSRGFKGTVADVACRACAFVAWTDAEEVSICDAEKVLSKTLSKCFDAINQHVTRSLGPRNRKGSRFHKQFQHV